MIHNPEPRALTLAAIFLVLVVSSVSCGGDDDASRVTATPDTVATPTVGDDDTSPGDDDDASLEQTPPGDDDTTFETPAVGDDDLSPENTPTGDDDWSPTPPGDDDSPVEDGDQDGFFPPQDCDDQDPTVNPGADEVCGDGLDNNCDGWVDKGGKPLTWYPDMDGDGFGNEDQAVVACAQPEKFILEGGDCDDTRADVNPAAEEVCDDSDTGPLDNDCDGEIDEGLINACGLCGPTPEEICNHLDDDCNGVVDDVDLDGDGVYDCADYDGDGVGADEGDCDDGNPTVYPGADESCDGFDNDCDGALDEDGDCPCVVDSSTGPYTRIQDALTDLLEGRVDCSAIVVHPGTYPGRLDLTPLNQPLRIVASGGPDVTTITLAQDESGSVVTFSGPGIQADVALVGFTITGGTGGPGDSCPMTDCGGGIRIEHCAAPTLEGNVVVGNIADAGGGIFVGDCDDPDAPGPTLSNTVVGAFDEQADLGNRALMCYGGGLYVGAATVTLETGTTLQVAGNTIGMDDGTCFPYDGRGVGIHVNGGTIRGHSVRMEVRSNHYQTDTYNTSGGGLYLADARLELTDAVLEISSNVIACTGDARCQGGALYANRSDFVLDRTEWTVRENHSSGDAGGVYLASGALTAGSSDGAVLFDSNEAGGQGGALVVGSGARVAFDRATFANNLASSGGAIGSSGEVVLSNSVLTGNHAGEGNGGAIASAGLLDLTGCTFSSNMASGRGGAVEASGTLRLSESEFEGNTAGESGGALALLDGSSWEDGEALSFVDNRAEEDGGAVHAGQIVFSLSQSVLESNRAGGSGGAVVSGGSLTITSSVLRNNQAGGDGGALLASPTATGTTLAGVHLSGNAAYGTGGSLLVSGGDLTVSFAVVDGNRAGRCGAMSFSGSTALLEFAHVYANTSTGPENGAVLCLGGQAAGVGNVILADNVVQAGSTGAILITASTAAVEYTTILRTLLAGDEAAELRVQGSACTVTLNTLVGRGTGVGIIADADATVAGCSANDIAEYTTPAAGADCATATTDTPPFLATSDDGDYCNEDLHLAEGAEHPDRGAYGGPDGDWTLVPPACGGCDATELLWWYRDEDGDTYGSPDQKVMACERPQRYVSNPDDCDDYNMTVHPGAEEIPRNGIDDDCDGAVDERF